MQVVVGEFGVVDEMLTDTDARSSSLGNSNEQVVGVMEQRFASCVAVAARTLAGVEFSGAAAGTRVDVAVGAEAVVDPVVEMPCEEVGEEVAEAGSLETTPLGARRGAVVAAAAEARARAL